MAEQSVFDALVATLSVGERRDLLERIRRSAPVSTEPLFTDEALPEGPKIDLRTKSEQLGFFTRLVLFLRRLFSGRSIEELLVSDELRTIARTVEVRFPGLLDYKRSLLLEGLFEQLRGLRDSARFFSEVLATSFDKDKGAFLAFLVSIEIPELHARLLEETDPVSWAEKNSGASETEVRSAVLGSYEDILQSLSEDKRRTMYQDLRSLFFLRRLGGFLFERLLSAFKPGQSASGGAAATFAESRDLLLQLGDILLSLSSPPSVELMEALFVFSAGEELGKPEYDAEASLGAKLAATEEALERIRSFNVRVPLVELLRLVTGDPAYRPRELPGGEDWFATYKAFWKERVERGMEAYRVERRYRETVAEIASFLGKVEPSSLVNVSREGSPETPPIQLELALVFLEGFYRGPFLRELNRPLKILLVEGDFYRKENRIEFTDAYNELLHIPENLAGFDARLSPEGEIGSSYALAKNELISLQLKRRKIQGIERGAEDEAERIVRRIANALNELVLVLRGVLKGEAGGRYDSLQNLSFLDGKANREFLRSLDQAKGRCEKAFYLLKTISGLELEGMD